jgi:hypothetical protein
MHPDCQQFEERLIDRACLQAGSSSGSACAVPSVVADDALGLHLDECGSCRERLAQIERHVASLRSLPRPVAPTELDELVELGMQEGGEAQRAGGGVGLLERREAPSELDDLVAASLQEDGRALRAIGSMGLLERQEAPPELDGRVVAALQAGYRQDRAIDEMHRLERLDPPAMLEEQVVEAGASPDPIAQVPHVPVSDLPPTDDLTRRAMHVSEGTPTVHDWRSGSPDHVAGWRRLARSPFALGGVAAAALLLVWAGLAGPFAPQDGMTPGRYSFEVVEVSSVQDLSPMGRGMLDSAVGGALTGWERSR